MKCKIFQKCIAVLLALTTLPTGVQLIRADAETTVAPNAAIQNAYPALTQSPEQLVEAAQKDNLLSLCFATLLECTYVGGGYAASFSEKNQQLLDINCSGAIDSGDVFFLLYWCAYFGANGVYPDEAQAFLEKWAKAAETTPPDTATMTTTLSVTTAAAAETTVVSVITEADTSAPETTVPATTVPVASETTGLTTTSTTSTTTVTTTTTAPTTTLTGAWAQKSYYDGIDVSKWQGNVNWNAVKAAGNDFAIIRAGYGKYASQEDPYFDVNMKNAKAAGIACGAYWYSYATTPAEAEQEAEVFASVIAGYTFEYPLVFDIEDETQTKLSKEQVSAIIQAFCNKMEEKGYYVSLYSYASFLNNYVYQSVLEDYDIWVAHFGVSKPNYSKTSYGIWQYTDRGTVNGVSGKVDRDYSYKCYPSIMEKYHLNGF